MDKPKVAVIIPTYNRVHRVSEAIDSVLAQTLQDFELIVVDDGSTDETESVLKKKYGVRIRYIRQENQGPAAARNTGIRAARSELIAFLDSDDIWLRDKLESQLPAMQDKRVILSYTNHIDEKDETKDYFSAIGLVVEDNILIIEDPLELLLRKGGSGIITPTVICRKDIVQKAGYFDERMRLAEDIRLWFRLTYEGAFAIVPKPLVKRRWMGQGKQLLDTSKDGYYRESAALNLEVFMETYARASGKSRHVQSRLRQLIASCLASQAKYLAIDRDYREARRKSLESLAFSVKGRSGVKAMICLIFPNIYRIIRSEKLCKNI